jgi:avirulence D protein (AvrD)
VSRPELRYPSIEDYLGPSANRFFGRGFRRVTHHVTGIEVDPPAVGGGTRAKVTIEYPADWSKKGRIDLPPHLSTVDMLLLGAQLSELHLAHAHGLDDQARRQLWLRKVILRAGNVPQEDLDGLDGTAKLVKTEAVPGEEDRYESVYATSIGAMSARCFIRHPKGKPAEAGAQYATIADALGDGLPRYYGEGFKFRQQHIEDVRIDMAGLTGSASVRLETTDGGVPQTGGMEGAWQPSVSLVDCFVTELQLAQILMYELDSIRRQDSHTLWMLKTVLEAATPDRPVGGSHETTLAITGKELLPLRGATWRNVDIEGECAGISLKCSFAHQLPAAAAAG